MASETFFDDGERVKLAKWFVKGLKHEKALLRLAGTVIGCDDTARVSVVGTMSSGMPPTKNLGRLAWILMTRCRATPSCTREKSAKKHK